MYLEVAPEGQAMPYVVFNHDFVQPKFVQGGYSDIEPDNLTFKVYASSAATAESLARAPRSACGLWRVDAGGGCGAVGHERWRHWCRRRR
jgi:hypothetical protein